MEKLTNSNYFEEIRNRAATATPASVFDDQTHCGYLRDAFSALRYPKVCGLLPCDQID